MIEDVLKQHKPGDKPRFFLHDEMKAWLKDHLDVKITHGENRSSDYDLQRKLGISYSLPVGFYISLTLSLDKEPVVIQQLNLPMPEYERAFKAIANVSENCIIQINRLISEVQILQERVKELEKR
jgi:hypothetical protein